MTKIIGIAGRKQSGKNTVANIINGHVLQSLDMIQEFRINESGSLEIKTSDSTGNVGWGIFDLLRKDEEFISYAETNMWPYVKIYHFADYLKEMCVELFNLSPRQVYGTDDDKNTNTPYGMTAREFLQYFGTNVMRKIKDDIWCSYTIKTILQESPSIALIPDVRFPNEVAAIKDAGGIVIRLTRNVHNSDHECEKALDKSEFDWNQFDYIVENDNCDINGLVAKINNIQDSWSN